MINVAIVDDHGITREGIKSLIKAEEDINVAFEAADGRKLPELLDEHEIDILILDIELPGMNGIEVLKMVKKLKPKIRVLMLSTHDAFFYMQECIQAGAAGFIVKHDPESDIIQAIRSLVEGRIKISENINRSSDEKDNLWEKFRQLTPREMEIVKLIMLGLNNQQIGTKLNINVRTVEGHRLRIYRKLKINSISELIRLAHECGIVDK